MTARLVPSRSLDEVLVTAEGELDLATAGDLRAVLDRACRHVAPLLVLDLTAVRFMDCMTLGTVLAARERMHTRGGDLVVRGASRPCLRLLALTGLTGLLGERPQLDVGTSADVS